MADDAKKQSLIQKIHESRGQIAGNIAGLRQDLSIGKRFRRNVRENRLAWIAGAAVLGLLLAKIPTMGKKTVAPKKISLDGGGKKAGKAALLLSAVQIAMDLGRPFITGWLKDYVKNRQAAPPPPPPPPPPRPRPATFSRAR